MKKWYLKIVSGICTCLFLLHPLSVYTYAYQIPKQDLSQNQFLDVDQKMIDAVKSNLRHQQIIGPGTDAIVASHVVHQTKNDKILRIAAYIKYKVISLDKNKDIQHETVAPFEFILIEEDGQIKAYCGALFTPPKIDSSFGPEVKDLEQNLLKDLKHHASQETYKTVSNLLKSESKFLDDTWEKIIGKPYEQASPEEIEKGFKKIKEDTENQYEKVEVQYYKRVPSTDHSETEASTVR